MTPQEYCAALEQALSPMPPEERQETIRYYLEFLEEASEEERAALGTPQELAAQLLRDSGIFPTQNIPPSAPQIIRQNRRHHRTALHLSHLAAAAAGVVRSAADGADLYRHCPHHFCWRAGGGHLEHADASVP